MLRSHGYYLDHLEPAAKHYEIDPVEWYAGRERPSALQSPNESPDEGKVLGGEACAWSEYMDRNNYLGRVFPRLAAVAERLWTRDLPAGFPVDAYFATAWYLERMKIVEVEREHDAAVERLLDTAERAETQQQTELTEQVAEGVSCVASLVEPLRIGDRASKRKWDEKGWGTRAGSTRHTPLTMLGDLALTDSWVAHELVTALEPLFEVRSQPAERAAARMVGVEMVEGWRLCLAPVTQGVTLASEPGFGEITRLLDKHLSATLMLLKGIARDGNDALVADATARADAGIAEKWVGTPDAVKGVTKDRENADVCVAKAMRAVNAQLAQLFKRSDLPAVPPDEMKAAEECGMVMDVDLIGGDMSQHGGHATCWQQCCTLCDGAETCEAWTYVPVESMCWLKGRPTSSKERLGLVSGWAPDKGRSQRASLEVADDGVVSYLRQLLAGFGGAKGEL